MPGKTRHLSKTDLRRGLFTKAKTPPATVPEPATTVSPGAATSAAEQALLFDLAPFDAAPQKRTREQA